MQQIIFVHRPKALLWLAIDYQSTTLPSSIIRNIVSDILGIQRVTSGWTHFKSPSHNQLVVEPVVVSIPIGRES
jgi:hypothetical protein